MPAAGFLSLFPNRSAQSSARPASSPCSELGAGSPTLFTVSEHGDEGGSRAGEGEKKSRSGDWGGVCVLCVLRLAVVFGTTCSGTLGGKAWILRRDQKTVDGRQEERRKKRKTGGGKGAVVVPLLLTVDGLQTEAQAKEATANGESRRLMDNRPARAKEWGTRPRLFAADGPPCRPAPTCTSWE